MCFFTYFWLSAYGNADAYRVYGYGTCFCLYLLENKTNYYTNFSTCFNQFLRCINPACRQCRKVRKNAGRVNDFFESIKKESKYKDVHDLFYNGCVVYVRRFCKCLVNNVESADDYFITHCGT